MKRVVGVLAAAALVVGIVWMSRDQSASTRNQREASHSVKPTAPLRSNTQVHDSECDATPEGEIQLPRKNPRNIATLETIDQGPTDPAESILAPATALENIRATVRNYAQRFGENPVGNNMEITAALTGKNSRNVVFFGNEDGVRVNDKGELVDNWNTPYFFHQVSRLEMEIHSAGADRRMWTADDLIVK